MCVFHAVCVAGSDLPRCISGVRQLQRQRVSAKNLKHFIHPKTHWWVWQDTSLLRHVITPSPLLSTALRFDTANFSFLTHSHTAVVSSCQFLCLRLHICLLVCLRYVNSRVVAGRTWWRQCRQSVWQGH